MKMPDFENIDLSMILLAVLGGFAIYAKWEGVAVLCITAIYNLGSDKKENLPIGKWVGKKK